MDSEVIFVIGDLKSGGAQRVLTTLANTWAGKNRRICVITLAGPEQDFFTLHPAVHRIVVGGTQVSSNPLTAVLSNLRRILNIRKAIKKAGAPVVVGFVGSTNILVILASIGLKKRVVISERNDPARQSLGRFWDWMRRLTYRFADVVTANTRGALDTLSSFVPKQKLALVPNMLMIPEKGGTSLPKRKSILAVGRLSHQKAYDVVLVAFAKIHLSFPEWRLEIIGEGELKESLEKQAKRLKIATSIIWHGRQNDPFSFYRATEIFVLASRYEGMPNAMLEAMACGMPVVVTNASPGPLEYVTHDKTGLVVPVEDSDALADALLELMHDPELRDRFGRAGKVRVAECDIENVLPVWEKVLNL